MPTPTISQVQTYSEAVANVPYGCSHKRNRCYHRAFDRRSVTNHATKKPGGLLSGLFNPHIPELHDRKLVVQLEPDRPRLRPLRIARMLGHDPAVNRHRDLIVSRHDVHGVPVVV